LAVGGRLTTGIGVICRRREDGTARVAADEEGVFHWVQEKTLDVVGCRECHAAALILVADRGCWEQVGQDAVGHEQHSRRRLSMTLLKTRRCMQLHYWRAAKVIRGGEKKKKKKKKKQH
jgi:hypothetical protein